MKKRKGNVVDIIPAMIVILAIMIIITEYFSFMGAINMKSDIKQIARAHLLEMETVGYMTASDRTILLQQLNDLSVTNVDLSGTTFSNVGYGNEIYLQITCNIPAHLLNTSSGDMLSFAFQQKDIPVTVKLMSTAKN